MEYWDVYDSKRRKTGKIVERDQEATEGEYHLIVHVWIRISDNRYVIAKRTQSKRIFPGLWETTGGCVVRGEDSLTAARREVGEEIGIELDVATGHLFESFLGKNHLGSYIIDVWEFNQTLRIEDAVLQESEVAAIRIASGEEIVQLLEDGLFVPECASYIHRLFRK